MGPIEIGIWAGVIIAVLIFLVNLGMKEQLKKNVSSVSGFTPSQQFIGNDGLTSIALDESTGKICLSRNVAGNIINRIINIKDILSIEIYEDGTSVNKTSRLSQAGSAIIGGVLLGGVGAVVGGLTGSTYSSNKINRIDLRLTIDDISAPIHDVNFLNSSSNRGGMAHNVALKQVRHWYNILDIMMKKLSKATPDLDNGKNQHTTTSVTDELLKLSKLKSDGAISEEEFVSLKQKLLPPQESIQLVDNNTNTHGNAGEILSKAKHLISINNFYEAIELLDEAINNNIDLKISYYLRAYSYGKLQNNDKAIQDLKVSASLGHHQAIDYLAKKQILTS